MEATSGEAQGSDLRLAFDRRLKLEFHGTKVTSDGGLLACRELDDVLGLSETAGDVLTDTRTGANGRHTLLGQFRQSVFGRLAGYEDVNDADRLAHDPAMRWVVGGQAVTGQAASTSQMGRFETEVLTQDANLSALADLSGCWIDRVHARRPVRGIVLDMDCAPEPWSRRWWLRPACRRRELPGPGADLRAIRAHRPPSAAQPRPAENARDWLPAPPRARPGREAGASARLPVRSRSRRRRGGPDA